MRQEPTLGNWTLTAAVGPKQALARSTFGHSDEQREGPLVTAVRPSDLGSTMSRGRRRCASPSDHIDLNSPSGTG